MNDFLERLEAMGRSGGTIAVGVAIAALVLALGLFAASFEEAGLGMAQTVAEAPQQARWARTGLRFAAAMAFVVSLPAAFVGVRLLTQRQYPSASEVFPAMGVHEIEQALAQRDDIQCVCTRCRVMVPAAFSTGSCPVCASSVEYHEVHTDEDARIVVAALG